MKSEHRHELKTNELSKLAERAGPFFDTYGNYILWSLVVVILATTGAVIYFRNTTSAEAVAWTELAAARSPDELARVADTYASSPAGAWARLQEAESLLSTGVRLTFEDRESAMADLKRAKESYEQLLNMPNLSETVREKGLFGLARTLETLSGENTEPAQEAYQRLIDQFPDSVYRPFAEDRIAELKKDGTQEFYAWFQEQNPKPPDRSEPVDGHSQPPGMGDPFSSGSDELPPVPPLLQLPSEIDLNGEEAAKPPASEDATDPE